MPNDLQPGPAMDAAVAALMGVQPLSTDYFGHGGWTDHFPAYSTSGAWEAVADWLVGQGFAYQRLTQYRNGEFCFEAVKYSSGAPEVPEPVGIEGDGLTRAEAVCRAALTTKGEIP